MQSRLWIYLGAWQTLARLRVNPNYHDIEYHIAEKKYTFIFLYSPLRDGRPAGRG